MNSNTLTNFVRNFIQKDKRERVDLHLKDPRKRVKFTDLLNHKWDTVLDMRRFVKIPAGNADNYEFVKRELKITDKDLCYVISNHDEIDGEMTDFKTAFRTTYGRGFGSIVITVAGDKLYLETEVVPGRQNRFIAK